MNGNLWCPGNDFLDLSLSYSFSMMSGISSAFQNLETILCIKIAWCSLLINMFLFMQKLAYDICWCKKNHSKASLRVLPKTIVLMA